MIDDSSRYFYETFKAVFSPATAVGAARASAMRSHLAKYVQPQGGRVLDLCCGAGIHSFELEKMGLEVVACDLTEALLEEAKAEAAKTSSKIEFVLADALRMDFPDEHFDSVVLLGNTIPHFSIGQFAALANGVHRVLRGAGRFLIDYYDSVHILLERTSPVEYDATDTGTVVITQGRYDPGRGTFERLYQDLGNNDSFVMSEYLWAPWSLRHVVENADFRLVDAEKLPPYRYVDCFERGS